ncbi:chaperone protein DnaJ-like isoform X2 [Triticum dicoccoides]|uniref:chaperone protein DnaJ-like isoform X2 n=1 Tax=Triticum dicoccoides TaxID=85692 RepID=UPI00188E8B13|nr:chaperone protein DnaJ-like isoform X2 [Triticum dicoccoides]
MDASAGAGSGNAPGAGAGAGASSCCYYALLGIRKNASSTDIRAAYRRLAMKWHPDRWASDPGATGEAKRRFQRIQEAYSVLSDKGKRAMYDAGLFDPLDDDDQDFSDFMQEMLVMMDSVKNEPDTLEDLQKMLDDIVNGDGGSRATAGAGGSGGGGGGCGGRVPPEANRRTRVAPYPQPSRR